MSKLLSTITTEAPELIMTRVKVLRGDGRSLVFYLGYIFGTVKTVTLNGCMLQEDIDYTIINCGTGEASIRFEIPPGWNDTIVISYKEDRHKCYYFWCPVCLQKFRVRDQITHCIDPDCKSLVIPLDINDTVFQNLPHRCTKGDIVEMSIDEVI